MMSKEFYVEIGKYYTGTISHRISVREHKHVEVMKEVRKVTGMSCGSSLQTDRFVTYQVVWQQNPTKRSNANRRYTISMPTFLKWMQWEVHPIESYRLGNRLI